LETPAEKRSDVQKYLVEKLGPAVNVTPAEIDQVLDEAARQKTAELNSQINALSGTKRSYDKLQALWDLNGPPPTYLYRRGDYQTPGPLVVPGIPVVLDNPADPFILPAPAAGAATSGYRTALARWVTRPDHPLTARVFVNRAWQHLFGRGIVSTPDNFGLSGAAPTHPQLLDWLAVEFVDRGWSTKGLLRRMLESSAYRQASVAPDAAATGGESIDPENTLLWRMPLRRLEAEIVRDSILAVSGALDPAQGPLGIAFADGDQAEGVERGDVAGIALDHRLEQTGGGVVLPLAPGLRRFGEQVRLVGGGQSLPSACNDASAET